MWNPSGQPVPTPLDRLVAELWLHVTPSESPGRLRLLPDGHTDLLIRFDDFDPRRRLEPTSAVVVGPTATYQLVDVPPRTGFLGVRFRPEAAEAVFRVSPAELAGGMVPVADCSPHLKGLAGRILGATDLSAAASVLTATLCEFASVFTRDIPPPVSQAVRLLACPHPGRTVTGVARTVGLTERTLHRRVLRATGLPPKVLARISRFQRAVTALRRGSRSSLCQLALDCGYTDQAHMCRDFQSLAGVSPTGLLENGW
jgi:AraC-like DNA-binding protein